mmetsp:Transcript_22381/g.48639  ORF Transcript_22381/g.48639 Transcript_22381/m.48639 type:complete len:255 (+) Transcript_22381:57-821(+)
MIPVPSTTALSSHYLLASHPPRHLLVFQNKLILRLTLGKVLQVKIVRCHLHEPFSLRSRHCPNVVLGSQCKFFKQYPLRLFIDRGTGMDVHNLIILHSEVVASTLEVRYLHVHCSRQRHADCIGIVISILASACQERNVQPSHDPSQLFLDTLRTGNGTVVNKVVPTPLLPLCHGHFLVGSIGIQQCNVITRRIHKLSLGFICRLGSFPRSHKDLRHRHGCHDTHNLLRTVVIRTANQHLGQLRIQRQLCHLTS